MDETDEQQQHDRSSQHVVAKKKNAVGPSAKLSREVREMMSARPAEHAGYLLGYLLASVEGLRILAEMHAENMRTHMRFCDYHSSSAAAGPEAPLKIMLEDVVTGIATYNLSLNVHASRPHTDAWSFRLSLLPKYAPLTVVASKLHVRAKQALVSLMSGHAFDKRSDRGSAWVKYVHFRFSDILMAAYSPGVVLAAILLNTLSAESKVRARQMPLFRAVLMAHAGDLEFRPRRVPEKLRNTCARNVRHMQEAAHIFSVNPTEWSFAAGQQTLVSMARECERDALDEVRRVLVVVER